MLQESGEDLEGHLWEHTGNLHDGKRLVNGCESMTEVREWGL